MNIFNPKYETISEEHFLTIKKSSSVCFSPFYLHPRTSKQLHILTIDKSQCVVCLFISISAKYSVKN